MAMKKRIVFVNLHADWMLLKTQMVYIFKYSAAVKHGYLLKYLLEHDEEYEVCTFINDRGFSWLTHGNEALMKFLNLFKYAEHRHVMKYNGIPQKQIKVLHNLSEIRPDDMVILYNIQHNHYRYMDGVDAFKALSMLHFHGRADEEALIKTAGADCLFNEVNLEKTSELYRKYYHLDLPWVVHPFVYAERFKPIKPFAQRQNKAFAVGTITYKEHEEFLSVYTDPCDQPSRKQIKDNPEFFKDTIDCYSSDYLEDDPGKKILPNDNAIVKLYKRIYNRTHVGKQKKYFSFDMVEKFNDYKMCIVGEEILGVPGIGYVEGMACGCAYIGLDSDMYRDFGLIPGEHYISYDGTIEDLRRVIEYYQAPEHQEELERIAATGCAYVRENFNGNTAAENLLKQLKEQQAIWQAKKEEA